MKRRWLKIISLFLILGAIFLALWLVNKNIPYYGNLILEMNFSHDQPMISRLGPEVRVKSEADYLLILESPVYFDLRALPWFTKARIYLTFADASLELEGLGVQVGPTWQYEVKTPLTIMPVGDNGDWQKAVFDFDLKDIYQQKNVRRFLISLKSASQDKGGEFKIKDLKIILSR